MAAPRGERSPGQEPGGCGGPWGTLRGPPQALLPCPYSYSCPYPVLAGYSFLPPPLSLVTPLVSAPYEVPLGLPTEPGRAKTAATRESTGALKAWRAKTAATRESTGALKAWLAQHPRNPYPSKGEKVMLAVVSRMSLTQVSTWFANARRRLKKENKASWATRGASDSEDSEGEGVPAGAVPIPSPSPVQDECGGSPEVRTGPGQDKEPQKPKIWSVAEMLESPRSKNKCPPGVPVLEQV